MPLPLPIEFVFTRLTITEAVEQGVLILRPRMARIASDELPLEINVDSVIQGRVDERYLYLAKAVSDESKMVFANWVIEKDAETFDPFRSIFQEIAVAIAD